MTYTATLTVSQAVHSLTATDAFEELALPHAKDLFRTAVRMLRDQSGAEDCVQETYLQAKRCFHRFEPGTNCRAWLFAILFNVIRHYRRKQYKSGWSSVDFDATLSVTASQPAVSGELTDQEILAALDSIPENYRSVVLLCDVQEFAYKEASAILAIPIGTVMSRLSRGRAMLRAKLASRRLQNGFLLERSFA